jgi:hypothetical protein
MAIDPANLFRSYCEVDDSTTGRQAIEFSRNASYILIRFASGRYAAVKPRELDEKLSMWSALDLPLKDVNPNALKPYLRDAIQMNLADPKDKARVDRMEEGEILVVLSGSKIVGLLIRAETVRGDTQGKGPFVLSAEEPPPLSHAKPPDAAYPVSPQSGAQPSIAPPPAVELAPTASPSETSKEKASGRFINVEIKDRNYQPFDARTRPLTLHESYNLFINIDIQARLEALATAAFQEAKAFQPGEEQIKLTVRLISDDFTISPDEQILTVPRQGKTTPVIFVVEPIREGMGVINAVFLKDNNFVQALTLKFFIGELFKAEPLGRPVDAAFNFPRRDINLTVFNMGGSFQLVMTGPVGATASLPLSLPQLDQMTVQVRNALLEIVNTKDSQMDNVYQINLDIPQAIQKASALRLATEGWRLYQRIFFGPAADQQTKNLGLKLRELAGGVDTLNIQIFSKEFTLPWSVIYMADNCPRNEDEVDPEMFLGLKHVIEQIPLQPDLRILDSRMQSNGGIIVGLNLDTDIDISMKSPIIADQIQFWEQAHQNGQATVTIRRSGTEVQLALEKAADTPDQVMYFNCHAVSRSLAEGEGPDASALVFSNNQRLSLGDLYTFAGPDIPFKSSPLVFINACQSAELSPLFYDGFVPYFMAKGARGVIGTECDTPALFAKEWAKVFFERFLQGGALGKIVLDLRKEFYLNHNNILGLLYALYVDGDTHIEKQ